jgi:hypothetical protein
MRMHPLMVSGIVRQRALDAEQRAVDSRLIAEARRGDQSVARPPALRRTRRFRYRLSARPASPALGR